MNVEIGRQNIIILFGNNEAAEFHFWEYINGDQTFLLDSHRPFICSTLLLTFFRLRFMPTGKNQQRKSRKEKSDQLKDDKV
jgi:hypothetical protein